MNLSHIKLVVTDMDGTLLNSNGETSPEFYDIFKKLKKHNILFAVASGRQYYSLTAKLSEIKKDLIYIAENGALVVEGEKQLHLQPMQRENALELIKKVRKIGGKHLIVSGTKTAFIESNEPEFVEQVKKHYEKYELVHDLTKIDLDTFLKITICDLSGAEENSYPYVKDLKDKFQVKLSGEIWIDFTHKLAQKGNALKKVQDLKGISPKNTIVFGDYLNDIEMFEHAEYGFAMQNAHQDVKEAAAFMAKSNDAHGVELILKDLLRDL